jgi:hypothetical protein
MITRTIFARLSGISLTLFLAGAAFPVDRTAESRWTPSPIKVDGQADEWQAASLYSENRPAVSYAFKNDGRSLYILMVFRNAKSLDAIEATGIAIYCSPEGTNEKINGTRFIKEAIPVDRFISLLENQGKVLTEEDKGFLRTRFQYPVFEAYAIDREGKYVPAAGPPPGVEPPVFSAAKKENIVTYEFRIPLGPRAPQPAGLSSQPGKTIKVGFAWGGSAMKVLSTKTSWQSPQSIVSGDVFTGSGETRAQEFLSSFDGLSRPSLKTKEYSFWVDVKLAPNP